MGVSETPEKRHEKITPRQAKMERQREKGEREGKRQVNLIKHSSVVAAMVAKQRALL